MSTLLARSVAALLAIGAAWYALILTHVTVPAPPTGDSPPSWYEWQAVVQRQQWVVTALAILGMIGFAALVDQVAARWAGRVVVAGAALWTVGDLLQIGGHHAVDQMASHRNPIDTVNAIAFTVDTVTAVFECVALLAVGAGLVALAVDRAAPGLWRAVTLGTGCVVAVLGAGYGIDNGDMTDRLTVVVGLLVLPGWLLLSSRCFPEVPARGRVNA
jgi:hypothetical protein